MKLNLVICLCLVSILASAETVGAYGWFSKAGMLFSPMFFDRY